VKKISINADVTIACGKEELVLQSPSSPKDISLYYENS
jgi:hypothetical protein